MAYRRTAAIERKLSATRERLLRAARQLVAEGGFAALQVAAVAERAGVATGSVYRHFDDKAELAREVFRAGSQREVDRMAEALAGPGSVRERIGEAVTAWCRRAQEGRVLARALLSEPVDPSVEVERLVYRARYAELLAAAIAEGVASGELPPQDPRTSAACVVGALAEAVLGPHHDPEPGAIVRFVLSALSNRHGDPP